MGNDNIAGLLDRHNTGGVFLTKEEVLDLLAYVLSGGDPKNAMFAGR